MKKAILILSAMVVGSALYQCAIADTADYMETFDMFYWSVITTLAYWGFGLFKA